MTRAKNYKTVSRFVKVMIKILWPLFPEHGVVRLLFDCYYNLFSQINLKCKNWSK